MAYYELAQVFGGVPLRTTLESTNLPRASVDEIYTQIAADLKKRYRNDAGKDFIRKAQT